MNKIKRMKISRTTSFYLLSIFFDQEFFKDIITDQALLKKILEVDKQILDLLQTIGGIEKTLMEKDQEQAGYIKSKQELPEHMDFSSEQWLELFNIHSRIVDVAENIFKNLLHWDKTKRDLDERKKKLIDYKKDLLSDSEKIEEKMEREAASLTT